jgi:hypothetical protein
MNFSNALGFLGLGVLMHVAPGFLGSGAALDSESRSSLWLYFMSYVIGGVGSAYIAHDGYTRFVAVLSKIQLPALLRPASAKRPVEGVPSAVRVTS